MFAAVLLVAGGPVQAAERVRVGILKLTSSAPIFIGVEKGFFQEQGVDVELTFFQAAAPIATALAAGQIHVGATGLRATRRCSSGSVTSFPGSAAASSTARSSRPIASGRSPS